MDRFDGVYTEIAKETGSIEHFIDSFMSFLLRKTDFFYEADPGDKMGFPPGMAENIIASVFKKYQNEYYKKNPRRSIEDYNKKQEKLKSETQIDNKTNLSPQNSPNPCIQTPAIDQPKQFQSLDIQKQDNTSNLAQTSKVSDIR